MEIKPRKICIVRGVGIPDPGDEAQAFARKLEQRTGAMCVFHSWDHPEFPYKDPRSPRFGFGFVRRNLHELIMDAAYVSGGLLHTLPELPAADMYVGHSAGGIYITTRTSAPRVLMGCPVQLLMSSVGTSSESNVMNVMHARDPAAAVIGFGHNEIVSSPRLGTYFNMVAAHTCYWRSKPALALVAGWYEKWVKN